MSSKTFPLGGIHPPESKETAGKHIITVDPPLQAWIPLSQHIGNPSVPVVKVGDRVKVGTLLAEGQGMISAPVHASISGTIEKIDSILDPGGFRKPAILIKRDGDDWEESIIRNFDLDPSIKCEPDDAMNRINAGGLVGKGGATFPTRVKYMVPPGKSVDTLLINGVECEPYLTSDHALMVERPEEVILGTNLLRWLLGVKLAIICIEANKPDAIAILTQKVKELGYEAPSDYLENHLQGKGISNKDNPDRSGYIAVMSMEVKYPQGAEKQLIKASLGREVPSGKLPLDIGVTVNNVATAHSAYKILKKHKPMVERIVTVGGPGVRKPGNYKVRIGTTVREVLTLAEGLPIDGGKVILGGPMMGKTTAYLDIPVTKGMSGILVFPPDLAKRPQESPCIRCGACINACPMGLEPYLLEKLVQLGRIDESVKRGLRDCVECGSCSFVCPATRPIVDYIRQGKALLARAPKKS